MSVILFILSVCFSFSEENDNKFKVKELELVYGNIPNQNGYNNLVSIKQKNYSVYYDKKGVYSLFEANQTFSFDGNDYFFCVGASYGLKAVFLPENYTFSPFRFDVDLLIGFLTLSSQSYLTNWNWLIPETAGLVLSSNLNFRFKRFGLVLGYSQFSNLPFNKAFSIGLNYRTIQPKEFID